MMGETCWFCRKPDGVERMVFDREFDTPVHVSCIREALKKNPNDEEALLMTYLIEEDNARNLAFLFAIQPLSVPAQTALQTMGRDRALELHLSLKDRYESYLTGWYDSQVADYTKVALLYKEIGILREVIDIYATNKLDLGKANEINELRRKIIKGGLE